MTMVGSKRESRTLSWAMLALSVAFLAAIVWTLFINPQPSGQWRKQFAGKPVGSLPLEDMAGRPAELKHPSVLYFFNRRCRFCPPASDQLNAYLAANGAAGVPVYAVTNDWNFPQEEARKFAPGVQIVRLTQTVPHLTFVTEIPLFVRTDAAGAVQSAYVGVPERGVLGLLRAPWTAGSAAR